MEDIFNKIIELVKNNTFEANDNCVKFSDPNYEAFEFRRENFHSIKGLDKINKIAFVDGGNAEIIKSSNFSLNLIRVYYSIYSGNKKVKSMKTDFYSFTYAKDIDNELFYSTEIISPEDKIIPDKNDLLLNSFDQTIKEGIARANISTMANLVRRFSEIKIASIVADNLEENDIIVLDGSLQCTFTNERKYLEELYDKALKKKVIVSGLSKTTTLLTDKGNSIGNALNKFNFPGKWFYHPVANINSKEHKADIAFVKLHENSKHIFRFEVYKEQKEQLNEVISLLARNCKDPIFVGYPYGLIDADRSARISNNEKSMMRTFFSVKFGKDWEKIKESLSNIDAHEILDSIS